MEPINVPGPILSYLLDAYYKFVIFQHKFFGPFGCSFIDEYNAFKTSVIALIDMRILYVKVYKELLIIDQKLNDPTVLNGVYELYVRRNQLLSAKDLLDVIPPNFPFDENRVRMLYSFMDKIEPLFLT